MPRKRTTPPPEAKPVDDVEAPAEDAPVDEDREQMVKELARLDDQLQQERDYNAKLAAEKKELEGRVEELEAQLEEAGAVDVEAIRTEALKEAADNPGAVLKAKHGDGAVNVKVVGKSVYVDGVDFEPLRPGSGTHKMLKGQSFTLKNVELLAKYGKFVDVV